MSYQERRTVVNILSGIAIVVAYCVYAFGRYQAGLVAAGDLKILGGDDADVHWSSGSSR